MKCMQMSMVYARGKTVREQFQIVLLTTLCTLLLVLVYLQCMNLLVGKVRAVYERKPTDPNWKCGGSPLGFFFSRFWSTNGIRSRTSRCFLLRNSSWLGNNFVREIICFFFNRSTSSQTFSSFKYRERLNCACHMRVLEQYVVVPSKHIKIQICIWKSQLLMRMSLVALLMACLVGSRQLPGNTTVSLHVCGAVGGRVTNSALCVLCIPVPEFPWRQTLATRQDGRRE